MLGRIAPATKPWWNVEPTGSVRYTTSTGPRLTASPPCWSLTKSLGLELAAFLGRPPDKFGSLKIWNIPSRQSPTAWANSVGTVYPHRRTRFVKRVNIGGRSSTSRSEVIRFLSGQVWISETVRLSNMARKSSTDWFVSRGQVWIVLDELVEERVGLGVYAVVAAERSSVTRIRDSFARRRRIRRAAPAARRRRRLFHTGYLPETTSGLWYSAISTSGTWTDVQPCCQLPVCDDHATLNVRWK